MVWLGLINRMKRILHIKVRSVQIMDYVIEKLEHVNVLKDFLDQPVKEV